MGSCTGCKEWSTERHRRVGVAPAHNCMVAMGMCCSTKQAPCEPARASAHRTGLHFRTFRSGHARGCTDRGRRTGGCECWQWRWWHWSRSGPHLAVCTAGCCGAGTGRGELGNYLDVGLCMCLCLRALGGSHCTCPVVWSIVRSQLGAAGNQGQGRELCPAWSSLDVNCTWAWVVDG